MVEEIKLRKVIRKTIIEQLNEAPKLKNLGKILTLPFDRKTAKKISKIIKKLKLKIDKDYDVKIGPESGGKEQMFTITKKHYNKFLDALVKNNINPRG